MRYIILFLFLPILAYSQGGTWPVKYNDSDPSGAPSAAGTRIYFNTATNTLWFWEPAPSSTWRKQPKSFDQISGCAAPAYTPTTRQSTFAVNSCTPKPELYQYTGSAWALLNPETLYTAGTGISIASGVITNTLPRLWRDSTGTIVYTGKNTTIDGTENIMGDPSSAQKVWSIFWPNQPTATYLAPFIFAGGRSGTPGVNDNYVMNIGFNVGPGGGAYQTGKPGVAWSLENSWEIGAYYVSEAHLLAIDSVGIQHRPLSYILPHGGQPALSSGSMGVNLFAQNNYTYTKQFWESNGNTNVWSYYEKMRQVFTKNNYSPIWQNRGPVYSSSTFPLIGYDTLGILQLGNPGDPSPTRIGNSMFFTQVGGVDVIGTYLGDGAVNFSFGSPGHRYSQVTIDANFQLPVKFINTGNTDGWAVNMPTDKAFGLYNYATGVEPFTMKGNAPNAAIFANATGVGINNNNPSRQLDVVGDVKINDLTTTTPTVLVTADNDGVLSKSTIGAGLSLSGGVLSNSSTATIGGSGASGQVPYLTGATTIAGTNNHFWDITNNRLGVMTNTPAVNLDVHASSVTPNWIAFTPSGPAMFVTATENSTSGGSVLSAPETALILARSGIPGAVYSSLARFMLSKYATGGDGAGQLDIAINKDDDTPVNIMSLRHNAAGIGTTNPAASAKLDITSTTQGFLPPRMTTTQRDAISSPATGLTVYCTDCTAFDLSTGVMVTWNGATWKTNW